MKKYKRGCKHNHILNAKLSRQEARGKKFYKMLNERRETRNGKCLMVDGLWKNQK
jgi:hypothetical protein